MKFSFLVIYLVVVNTFLFRGSNAISSKEYSEILDKISFDYDKRIRPSFDENVPVNVTVTMYMSDLEMIDSNSQLKVNFFLRLYWNDNRLDWSELKSGDLNQVSLNTRGSIEHFWTPDVFFPGAVSVHKKGDPEQRMSITYTGDVRLSEAYEVTVKCESDMTKYPFEPRTCDLAMESYSFTTNEMTLKWKNNAGRPIDIGADLDQPQFIMTQMKDTNNAFVFSTGSFDNVQVILYFVYKFI
ncbi:glycine receptor subunit alpha-3-like [Convolutriloba macropyga]|uniref:glycine receptor subunit alpha-3-like n=1 Tax=Convolutriloba macropyga TaxID=536237 RepID=UPI003F5219F6